MGDTWRELDREAVIELHAFALARLQSTDAPPVARVERDVSCLRWLLRRSRVNGGSTTLTSLSEETSVLARIFREPGNLTRADASTALHAFRAFLFTMKLPDATDRFEALEAGLIPRRTRGWNEADRVAGGHPGAERSVRLLFAEDLIALPEHARRAKQGENALRDATLVAVLCWSALRWQEVIGLEWGQLSWQEASSGEPFGAWARCVRNSAEWDLPLHREASTRLASLYGVTKHVADREPRGPVFRILRHPYRPLSYREAKDILDNACSHPGYALRRRDLLAAYAFHLMRRYGFTIPDLRELLGYSDIVNVRRLLKAHLSWESDQQASRKHGPVELPIGSLK